MPAPSPSTPHFPLFRAAMTVVCDWRISPPGAAIKTEAPGVEYAACFPVLPTEATGIV